MPVVFIFANPTAGRGKGTLFARKIQQALIRHGFGVHVKLALPSEIEESDLIGNYSKNIIKIQHNQYPDIFVEHIPELNFISFLCDFGGLLGMWLGWSFFEILNDISYVINKISYLKYINLTYSKLIYLINYLFNQVYLFNCMLLLAYKTLTKRRKSRRIYPLSRLRIS